MGEVEEVESRALPRGNLLNYISVVDSPTRVRLIASRGLLAMGLLELVMVGGVLLWLVLAVIQTSLRWGAPLLLVLERVFMEDRLFVVLIPALGTLALLHLFFVKPVRMGNSRASGFVSITLIPLILLAFAGSLGSLLLGGYWMTDRWHPSYGPSAVCMLVGILLIPGLLLINDLRLFLEWIRKSPAVEKPPVPFIS